MIHFSELVQAKVLGEDLRASGVDPMDWINQSNSPQSVKQPIQAKDGFWDDKSKQDEEIKVKEKVEVKAPGEKLPQLEVMGVKIPRRIFGIDIGTQAAEKFTGSKEDDDKEDGGIFDSKKHKMRPSEVRDLIKQITVKGLMLKKSDKEIMGLINNVVSQAGYTNDELSPSKIKSKAIKGYELYNTDQPNPFPAYKLISAILGGTAGNIVGGRTGAAVGARVGALGGPWGMIAGSIIGGTLGYVGSLLGYEMTLNNLNKKGMLYTPTYNEIGEFVGNRQGINRPTKEKLMEYLKHEAKIDAMFQGGFFAARPVFKALGKGLGWAVGGVGKKELELGRSLEKITGVAPSMVDISRYEIVRAMPTVIGRLPFFRRPFIKAAEKQKAALLNTAKDKLFLNGPTINLAELGHDMEAVRRNVTKQIATTVNKKYDDFYLALGDNPAIKIDQARAVADDAYRFMENLGIPPTQLKKMPFYMELENLIGKEGFSNIGKAPINAAAYKNMRTRLIQLVLNDKTMSPEMKQYARGILKGLEGDLGTFVKANPNLEKNAVQLLQEADKSFKDMMILFGDPAAKGLGSTQKFAYINMLEQPGNKYASELLDTVLKDFRDPVAAEKLHKLLGDQMFGKVMKAKVLDAFQNAFTKSTTKPGLTNMTDDFFKSFDDLSFDSNAFKQALGLDEAGKPLQKKLDTLIKALELGNKGSVKLPKAQDLMNFADAAQTFFNGKNMNISTFLTRRAALGGVESLLRVITPAAAVMGGYGSAMANPMGTLLGVGTMYYAGHILARPMLLETFGEAFQKWAKANAVAGTGKFTKSYQAAVLASQRAIRELFRSDTDIPDELDNRFNSIQNRMKYLDVGEDAFNEMKSLGDNDFNEGLEKIFGLDAESALENKGVIIPGAQPGDKSIDVPANIETIPSVNPSDPNVVTNNNISAKNTYMNNRMPTNNVDYGTKVNPKSALAIAGNDPLLQAIAMKRA